MAHKMVEWRIKWRIDFDIPLMMNIMMSGRGQTRPVELLWASPIQFESDYENHMYKYQ